MNFLTLTVWGPFHRKYFKWKKICGYRLISEKMEVLYDELKERVEAATGSYFATGDSLKYIFSVPVTKNHQNIPSRCLVHEFSFTDFFKDINHVYSGSILYGCGYLFLLWGCWFFFFLIGIHPMQGWTATMRHGVTRKEAQKRLQGTENLFRKNLQLQDVC